MASPQIPVDQPPWRCISAFKDHDYARCIDEARRSLAASVKPVELFLYLMSLQRLGRREEAEQLGPEFSDALRDVPWEQTLVGLIIGKLSREQALARATTNTEKFQANFYGGAVALTDGRINEAREANDEYLSFLAKDEWPECYEFLLAPIEFEQFNASSSNSPEPAKAKPWWKVW